MMKCKKRFNLFLAVFIGVFCALVSFGCAKNKQGPIDPDAPVTYTVTYHYNYDGAPNGGVYMTQEINVNGTASKPTLDPTRTSYTFTKWYTDAACSTEYNFSTPITAAKDIYAGWVEQSTVPPTPDKYTVTYLYNYIGAPNNGIFTTQEVDKLGTATRPATEPTQSGYTFTGWYSDYFCLTEYDFSTPITEAKNIYAGWEVQTTPEPTKYSVIINPVTNGTVTANKGQAEAGETVVITATPDSGYELATLVYNDGSDHDIKSTKQFTMPSKAVTVTATFTLSQVPPEPTKYAVIINPVTNGTVIANKGQAEAGESVVVTATPDSGYELATLVYNDGSDHDIKATKQFIMPSKAVTVTATFTLVQITPEQYTVTYYYNYTGAPDGGVFTTQTVAANGTATKPATDPTRTNYKFTKWYTEAECNTEYNFATPVTAAVDLYADWEEDPVLTGITVSGPTKKEYIVGQKFIPDGLTVTAQYSIGNDKTLGSSDYTYVTPDTTTVGTKTVTVSYTEKGVTKTADFTITVVAKAITSFTVSGTLDNASQYIGDTLSTEGLTFTATYNDASTQNVTSGITFTSAALDSGNKFIRLGTATITATYDGKSATFNVTVIEHAVDKFEIDGTLAKSVYEKDEAFDPTGLTFTATLDNNETVNVAASDVVFTADSLSGGKLTAYGTVEITASYKGVEATTKITVSVNAPDTLEKDSYYLLGTFNEWGAADNTAQYKVTVTSTGVGDSKEVTYVITNVKLAVDDKFKIAKYVGTSGADNNFEDWKNVTKGVSVNPSTTLLTVTTFTETDDYGNILISAIDASVANRGWNITVTEKGDVKADITLYNYIDWRNPTNGNHSDNISATDPQPSDVELRGNFTNNFSSSDAWSSRNSDLVTKIGNVYYFQNVYLKAHDSFKVVKVGATGDEWLGSEDTFALNTVLNIASNGGNAPNIYVGAITDGNYNIVIDAENNTITIYEAQTLAVSLKYGVTIKEGATPTKADLTVAYGGNEVAGADYTLIAQAAAHGANTLTVIFNGAIYELNYTAVGEYSVTFNKNTTYNVADMPNIIPTVLENATITEPTAPTLKGFTFDGWYKDDALNVKWNFETDKVTSAVTLYAKWTAIEYKVVYNGAASDSVLNYTAVNGLFEVVALNAPSKVNYEGYWYTAQENGDRVLALSYDVLPTVGDTITLYAQFTPITYVVEYFHATDDGHEIVFGETVVSSYTYLGTPVVLATPKLTTDSEKYVFVKWYFANDAAKTAVTVLNDETVAEKSFDNNIIVLKAEFSKKATYSVTFDLGYTGAPDATVVTVIDGGKVAEPADPKRDDYTFSHWAYNGGKWDFDSAISEDITLTAVWIENHDSGYYLLINDAKVGDEGTYMHNGNTGVVGKIENVTLAVNDTVRFVKYTKKTGEETAINFAYVVNPYGAITFERDNSFVFTVASNKFASSTYIITADTKQITFELTGYKCYRDMQGNKIVNPTIVTPTANTAYIVGNFTDEKRLAEWSDVHATKIVKADGTIGIYFMNVVLKADDKFNVFYNDKVGAVHIITTDGNYNIAIVVDAQGNIVSNTYAYSELDVTLNDTIYVGHKVLPENITVMFGSEVIASAEYELISTEAVAEEENIFTVIYNGTVKTVAFNAAENVVAALTVNSAPSKINYFAGDELALDGLTITLTYADGSTKTVSGEAVLDYVTLSDIPTVGNETLLGNKKTYAITVTAKDTSVSNTFNIDVYNKATSIAITTAPTKTSYVETERLDLSGMKITVYYNNSALCEVISKTYYTTNPVEGTVIGNISKFIVTYERTMGDTGLATQTLTVEQTLTVTTKEISSIEIIDAPTKVEYYIGDKADLSGLKIKVVYNDDTENEIAYSNTNADKFKVVYNSGEYLTINDTSYVIEYGGKSVTVNDITMQGFTVTCDANILYDVKNGIYAGSWQDEYLVQVYNQELDIVNPIRGEEGDEYIFDGWYLDSACTEPWDGKVTKSMTLYAKWIAQANGGDNVEVTYNNVNADGETKVMYYEVGSEIALEVPSVPGYTFVGWYTDAACTHEFNAEGIYTVWQEHTELYGKWTEETYTINYVFPMYIEPSSNPNPTEYKASDGVITLKDATLVLENYKFKYWSKTGDIKDTVEIKTISIDDFQDGWLTLYAICEEMEYVVTYHYNVPGEPNNREIVKHGQTVMGLGTPVYENHRFDGWYTDEQFQNAFDPLTEVKQHYDLYAKWVEQVYVTFFDGGDVLCEPILVDKGSKIPADKVPTVTPKEGFGFGGWEDDMGRVWNFDDPVTEMLNLRAIWTEEKVTVTFDANGGVIGDQYTVEVVLAKNTPIAVNKPADPTRDGYKFLGWFVEDEEYTDFDKDVDEDIVLTAKWAELFTVTFYWNYDDAPDGGVFAIVQANDDGTVSLDVKPERDPDKFAFNGWFEDKEGTIEFKFDTVLTKNMDAYAKWTALSQGIMIVNGKVEMRMLDNTDNMQADEKAKYDLNYAFFGEHIVTFQTGDELTFRVEGEMLSALTFDKYSKNAELVGADTVRILSGGEFVLYLKHNKTTKEWEIYVSGGAPIADEKGRIDYIDDKGFVTGQFEGDDDFEWGKGFLMEFDATANGGDGEWFIEIDLKEGEIFNLRYNATGYGYYAFENRNDLTANFEQSGNNIKVKLSGTYKIYFKPTWGSNNVYIAVVSTTEPEPDPDTSVILDKSELKLSVANTTDKITATADSAITWSSNNITVATVDAQGNVTAKKPGTAVITAQAENGDKATCTVTVADAYYLIGTMTTPNWTVVNAFNQEGIIYFMPTGTDGIYSTGSIELARNANFQVGLVGAAGDWWASAYNSSSLSSDQSNVLTAGSNNNIVVSKHGEYTITLNMTSFDPKISGIMDKEIDDGDVEDVYYLIGTMNGWSPADTVADAGAYAFTKVNDNEYTLTVKLTVGWEFKIAVVGQGWSVEYGEGAVLRNQISAANGGNTGLRWTSSANIGVGIAGTYTFTFNPNAENNNQLSYTYTA